MGLRKARLARALTGMRALIIGASGLVGGALLRQLGADAVGTFHTRAHPGLRPLDARDQQAVGVLIRAVAPEVIYFPAANANVDWCEREPAAAEAANLGPLRATLAAAAGIPLLAYSSDYVFDGQAGPYRETDATAPLSVYGRLKVDLEALVLAAGGTVIRPTWVFGAEPEPAKNFVLRLVASLRRGEPARLPGDQIATPTDADDLARASIRIAGLGSAGRGIWHIAGPDRLAKDAFGRIVAEAFGLDPALISGVPTAELAQAAARPLDGGLRCERYRRQFGTAPVRPVREALAELRAQLAVTA
ncbi:MAG: dTDP-4-dehydrorhamnose reductase [Candidatus Limnocylindrales bacterium]